MFMGLSTAGGLLLPGEGEESLLEGDVQSADSTLLRPGLVEVVNGSSEISSISKLKPFINEIFSVSHNCFYAHNRLG